MRIFLLITTIFASTMANASDLKEALSYAYLNNPSLQAAREDLKNAAEGTSQVLGSFLPNIDWSRSGSKTKSIGSGMQPGSRSYTNSMSVTQELFHGGASLAALKAQKGAFDQQVQVLASFEQDFMNKAIGAYVGVLQAKEALDINNNNVELYKQILTSAEEQFKFGQVTITDVANAKSNLAGARADQIKASGDYINAKANYRTYYGQEPENLKIPELPSNKIANLDALIEEAKVANPNLLQARAAVESSANNVWATTAGQISPYVEMNASGSKTNSKVALASSGGQNGDYQPNRSSSKQVMVNLTIPIYQGGGEYSKIRQSKIAYQKSQFAAASTMDSVIQNAISAWEALQTQSESLKSYEEQVLAATSALDGTKQEYEVGTKTLVELLKAEQDLFQAKLGLSTAKYNKLLAAFGIYASVGKLTAKGLELPVEYFEPSKYYRRAWNVLPNVVTSN